MASRAPDPQVPALPADGAGVRPTHIQVDLGQLARNLRLLQAHTGVDVMPVLKANAYGHGLVPVARALEAAGAAAFGVAYLEEGVLLRAAGVRIPVLVLGGILGNRVHAFIEHDLSITAPSVSKLRAIDAAAAELGIRARVHLKVDTGMNRIGVRWSGAAALLELAAACRHIEVEGIYSHFANADAADLTHARLQQARFAQVLAQAHALGLRPRWRHLSNSGGIHTLPASHLDLVRAGIALYGVAPSEHVGLLPGLRPALRWVTRVVFFKSVAAGEPVSYGSTWSPTRRTRIITLPVGYGDGYFRALSNRGHVIVRGRRCPIVGRVCMDQMMVDIGGDSAWNGDPVTLLGSAEGCEVSAEELAQWAGTIPYEVLTHINSRVPRVALTP